MGESLLQKENSIIIVDPDPFINSSNVAGLHPNNFMEFLKTKEAVLVYFYKTPDPENEPLKGEFAAKPVLKHRKKIGQPTPSGFIEPGDTVAEVNQLLLSSASCSTKRSSHAFAAVNCCKEKDLCAANKVTRTPRLNLYSRGFYVAHIQNAATIKEPAIRQFVETSPLLSQPKGDVEQL